MPDTTTVPALPARMLVPTGPLTEDSAEVIYEHMRAGGAVGFVREPSIDAPAPTDWAAAGWTSVGFTTDDATFSLPAPSPADVAHTEALNRALHSSKSVSFSFTISREAYRILCGLDRGPRSVARRARRAATITRSVRLARRARRRELARYTRETRRG